MTLKAAFDVHPCTDTVLWSSEEEPVGIYATEDASGTMATSDKMDARATVGEFREMDSIQSSEARKTVSQEHSSLSSSLTSAPSSVTSETTAVVSGAVSVGQAASAAADEAISASSFTSDDVTAVAGAVNNYEEEMHHQQSEGCFPEQGVRVRR